MIYLVNVIRHFEQRVQACESILAGTIDPADDAQRKVFSEQVQAIEDDAIAASLQDRYPRKPAAHSSPESELTSPEPALL